MSTQMNSTPTSVIGVWHGPSDARQLFLATTLDAAHQEIGKRAADGHPVINPEPVEMPVVGAPDPKSIEGFMSGLTKVADEIAGQFRKGA